MNFSKNGHFGDTVILTDRRKDRQTDGQIDRQTDKQTNGKTDKMDYRRDQLKKSGVITSFKKVQIFFSGSKKGKINTSNFLKFKFFFQNAVTQ